MPQPDNQRERGAATQVTQQQVAPQGQMAANISPISGGAAAAAPVLQIGQQAQIKQTGAELYQALAGIASGVQQGLQNYDKMYNMVSETQYADFETAYITESDRVKGDPAKLKTWLDNNSYKPNRVTAKRFHSLRAQVNGKAYEQDQMDQWTADLDRISKMDTTNALEYLNTKITQYDEQSPYFKQAKSRIIELQGAVANVATQNNLKAVRLGFQQDNYNLTQALRSNPTYAESLDDPSYQLVMTLGNLGLATVDPGTGQVTIPGAGQVFDLNAAGDFIPVMQGLLEERMASGAVRPDYVAQAMMAADLPKSVLGRGPGFIDPPYKVVDQLVQSLSIGDGQGTRSLLRDQFPASKETLDQTAQYLQGAFQFIAQDANRPAAERARLLQEMAFLLDYESGQGVWAEYGIENEDQFNIRFGSLKESVNDAHASARILSMEDAIARATVETNAATSPVEYQRAMQAAFQNEIIPAMASISNDANVIIFNPTTGDLEKISMEEYQDTFETTSGAAYVTAEGYIPIPVGVEVIDSELKGSSEIPFMVQVAQDGQFVFTGTGSQSTQQANKLLEQVRANWVTSTAAGNLQADVNQPSELKQLGLLRIAEQDPLKALAILGDPTRVKTRDMFPSGAANSPAFEAIDLVYNPDSISAMSGEERRNANALWGNAYLTSEQFRKAVNAKYAGRENDFLAFAYAGKLNDPNLPKDQYVDATANIAQLLESGEYSKLTDATDTVLALFETRSENIDAGFEESVASLDDIIGDLEDQRTVESKWQAILLNRAVTDYRTETGKSLSADLSFDAPLEDRIRAEAYLRNSLKKSRDISKIGNAKDPRLLMDLVETTANEQSNSPRNADDAYAPGGLSMTAQDQAIITVMDAFAQEDTQKIGVAAAFGFTSDNELDLFKQYLAGTYEPDIPFKEKFRQARYRLRKGISVVEISSNSQDRGFAKDKNGNSYRPLEYTISVNEEMMKQSPGFVESIFSEASAGPMMVPKGIFSWLTSKGTGPGVTPEFFEQLQAGKFGLPTIKRWQYENVAPTGVRNGTELLQEEHKEMQMQMTNVRGMPVTTGQALRP
jgi:hypothetical protein